jgi:hypothetical protein
MATNIVIVARSTVRAARLRVKSDRARGITPDPRMVRLAEAQPFRQAHEHAAEMTSDQARPGQQHSA